MGLMDPLITPPPLQQSSCQHPLLLSLWGRHEGPAVGVTVRGSSNRKQTALDQIVIWNFPVALGLSSACPTLAQIC